MKPAARVQSWPSGDFGCTPPPDRAPAPGPVLPYSPDLISPLSSCPQSPSPGPGPTLLQWFHKAISSQPPSSRLPLLLVPTLGTSPSHTGLTSWQVSLSVSSTRLGPQVSGWSQHPLVASQGLRLGTAHGRCWMDVTWVQAILRMGGFGAGDSFEEPWKDPGG